MYTSLYATFFTVFQVTFTAQTGLVYKNFLLLYMHKYKPVYSFVYELNLQASLQFL